MPSTLRSRRGRRITRPAVAIALAASCLISAAACASDKDSSGGGSTTRITDATGATVAVPAAPKRVVTLSEMDLDSALTLGVTPVGLTAGRGQQGAPGYLADRAKDVPVVGAVTGPDIEKVVRARPDVILAGQLADKQVLEQLRKVAPTVVTIDNGKDWKKSLKLTGEVLGRTNQADAFLADYAAKVAALRKDLGEKANQTVSVARYSPKGTAVMQQGVFASDVLADIGFRRPGIQARNGEGHSTPISDENLAQIDADWLFIGTLTSTASDPALLGQLSVKPAYQQLNAVQRKHATVIDGSMWTSLGGPQAAVAVLDDVRRAMTP